MWQGLDYEEINHAIEKIEKEDAIIIDTNEFYQGALWAEQRLKEKNQPIEEPQYLYAYKDYVRDDGSTTSKITISSTQLDIENYIGKIKLDR